ncbi:Conserved oligomeric Golgi complex subunit 2 [Actinomortierella ambigua]|uniref:Conserved oligomeric Golgi complex subunit 2 n=1 Tax=Actinomortierella ambigua TaxID=1343610 RepID=A0A9P6PU71_9FUNG|nr:Conserved oligomeric Golgi complex subunit 2 [Actinomortierella ambigua]
MDSQHAADSKAPASSASRKPSHLSIDSKSANSSFLPALNSRLLEHARRDRQQQNHQAQRHQGHPSEANGDEFSLSIGIDRAALIAVEFDTDEFLSARRHLPLEELKSQLIAHLKELRTELVELINSDYADFINLSTNLNGVDKMMNDVHRPLVKMKDSALTVQSSLNSVVGTLEQKLAQRAEIREKKQTLQLLLNISESVSKVESLLRISTSSSSNDSGGGDNSEDPGLEGDEQQQENISTAKRLERVASEYNQMQYLVSKGAGLPFVANIDWRLVRIKETMSDNLSNVLKACLHPSEDVSPAENKASLLQCLRTYALIDQTTEAETVITEHLIEPFVAKTITRYNLEHLGNKERRPLVAMYDAILDFIQENCTLLMEVTQKELKGTTHYDIPAHCLWPSVAAAILKNIPSILIAAHADAFHQNYTDTMDLVTKLEALCGSRRSLTLLRGSSSYQTFMKRWNLLTYFTLRSHEMKETVETAMQHPGDFSLPIAKCKSTEALLPASKAILSAIERCWSPNVFVYGASDSFWKFTLQLLARYSVWLLYTLKEKLDLYKDHGSVGGIISNNSNNTNNNVPSRTSSPAPLAGGSSLLSAANAGGGGGGGLHRTASTASLRSMGGGSGSNTTAAAGHAGGTTSGTSMMSPPPAGRNSIDDVVLQHLTLLLHDVHAVVAQVERFFTTVIQPQLPRTLLTNDLGDEESEELKGERVTTSQRTSVDSNNKEEAGEGEGEVEGSGRRLLRDALQQGVQALQRDLPLVEQRITSLLTQRCLDVLQMHVKAITMSNASPTPTEPSFFVPLILEPLALFFLEPHHGPGFLLLPSLRDDEEEEEKKATTASDVVVTLHQHQPRQQQQPHGCDRNLRQRWIEKVAVTTTHHYGTLLTEHLQEVQRREEMRNKFAKKPGSQTKRRIGLSLPSAFTSFMGAPGGASGGASGAGQDGEIDEDEGGAGAAAAAHLLSADDKVRLQFVLDVRQFKNELAKFDIDPDTFEPYKELCTFTAPYEQLLPSTGRQSQSPLRQQDE